MHHISLINNDQSSFSTWIYSMIQQNIKWLYWLALFGFFSFLILKKAPRNQYLINQPAPLLKGIQVDGSSFSLADLKGKVVVLDVWATWCRPCQKSLPALEKVYQRFKKDPQVWIGSINQEWITPQSLKTFLSASRFHFPVIRDPRSRLSNQLNVRALPTLVVIDPLGKITHVQVGLPTSNPRKLVRHLTKLVLKHKTQAASLYTPTPQLYL